MFKFCVFSVSFQVSFFAPIFGSNSGHSGLDKLGFRMECIEKISVPQSLELEYVFVPLGLLFINASPLKGDLEFHGFSGMLGGALS